MRDKNLGAAAEDAQHETGPAVALAKVVQNSFYGLLVVLDQRGQFRQQLFAIHKMTWGVESERVDRGPTTADAKLRLPSHFVELTARRHRGCTWAVPSIPTSPSSDTW